MEKLKVTIIGPDAETEYARDFVDRLCPDCANRVRELQPEKTELEGREGCIYKDVWICQECSKKMKDRTTQITPTRFCSKKLIKKGK